MTPRHALRQTPCRSRTMPGRHGRRFCLAQTVRRCAFPKFVLTPEFALRAFVHRATAQGGSADLRRCMVSFALARHHKPRDSGRS